MKERPLPKKGLLRSSRKSLRREVDDYELRAALWASTCMSFELHYELRPGRLWASTCSTSCRRNPMSSSDNETEEEKREIEKTESMRLMQ
jgi:hypothetical protein